MSIMLSGNLVPANVEIIKNADIRHRIFVALRLATLDADESYEGLEYIDWAALQKLESLYLEIKFNTNDIVLTSGRINSLSHTWTGEPGVIAFMEAFGEALKIPSMKELQLSGNIHLTSFPVPTPWEDEKEAPSHYRVNVKPDGTMTYQKLIRQWGEEVTPK